MAAYTAAVLYIHIYIHTLQFPSSTTLNLPQLLNLEQAGLLMVNARLKSFLDMCVCPYRPDVHREENVRRKTNINK